MVGTVLKHRYEVIEKIGEGSLFTVYRCEDKIDNRIVAAKVLLPQYASNRMFAERILVEAQAMAGMIHPGIVEVYDCGEEDGVYFVIVEYVRGVDLRERIRRNAPFSLTTVVDVGLAICDVLDYAHRRGFVHGDLRPGNVLVTPEGHIKTADFWVANAVASAQSLRTNALMRSVHYMAPEVVEGKPVTPGADVYSAGIILFELLTADVPFDGDTPIAIALKHARDPIPSLRALNPGIPKSLETAIGKALQKIPQDRFRSAKAMLNELKMIREGLNLTKPITWSAPAPDEKTIEVPTSVSEHGKPDLYAERPAVIVAESEPAVLAAVKKAMLVVVGLIALMVMAVMIWAMTAPSEVKVPAMVGKSLGRAQAMAADVRIEVTVRSEQFNEDYPSGTVYYMNPAQGRSIKEGKSVDVWVSRGSRYARTPNVLKLSLEEAKDKISAAGLNVGEVSQEYSDSVEAGNVLSQTPAPGTRQDRGQPVNVVFSLGAKASDVTSGEQPDQNATKAPRSFDVTFVVPEGAENQRVQIGVDDDFGENIAYSDILHPGDKVKQTVQGVGDKIAIRIYIDGKLVREERK